MPLLTNALIAVTLAASAVQDSPLKDIRSKDPAVRESAVKALAEDDSAKAEAALIKAVLKDDDVLVTLAVIEALSSREATARIEKALVTVALEAPFTRVRRSAAAALGRTSAAAAREALLRKSSGRTLVRAASALSASIEAAPAPTEPPANLAKETRKLEKALRSKVAGERAVAARALIGLTRGAEELRSETLESLVTLSASVARETETVCAALEAVAVAPDEGDAAVLLPLLGNESLKSVVERRLERAIARSLALAGAKDQAASLTPLVKSATVPLGPRLARILSDEALDAAARTEALGALLEGGDAATRAAAAKSLGSLGEKALPLIRQRITEEDDAPAQVQLIRVLEAISRTKGDSSEEATAKEADDETKVGPAQAAISAILAESEDDRVRVAAAVALGQGGAHPKTIGLLTRLGGAESAMDVRIAATVALGRTRKPAAAGALMTAAGDDAWQIRAAAAEGFKQLSAPASVDPLLTLLDDDHATVSATAHQALLRLSGREGLTVERETWPEWWKENIKKARFRTKEEEKELNERYGYGVSDSAIYKGLDVIVVPGRGDYIEGVLERLGIRFRVARAGTLDEVGLHPAAVLLVGCTGEVAPSDLESVRWFVQSGGALFSSCWALTYTVEASFPSVITRFPSPGEVVDNVFARPTTAGLASPYLRGVFDGDVQPFYALQGAHLIHVVDPERAEVLLDSPSAAARHGSGDLAAWFRMGHGICFNSSNHFAEQGFSTVSGLDKPLDRQAFAVNHMGYSLVQLRAMQDEKWWGSTSKTAKEISDLSVFRILTNFVRKKRIDG